MKAVKILLVVLIASVSIYAQNDQVKKIGFVDSEVILSQYPPAIKAQSDLDGLVAKWKTQLDSMMTAYQSELATLQKQFQSMAPDKQQEAQQKMAKKEMEYQQFQQQKFGQPNGEVYVKNQTMLQPVKEEILKGIEEVAKNEGMAFVFDKNQTLPVLLYGAEEFDITFKVLDHLKRGKKK